MDYTYRTNMYCFPLLQVMRMENQELFMNANAWAECEGSVTFRNATQKQEHYMQFHPEIQTSSKNEKGMKKADKEKACNLCTKKFISGTDLFNHQKYHRG
ncbi:hypothetical protein PRUPE_2G042200 [Prunus persica]|uniref:Uncharacterized protein n=1 Tax=Prunus persica TaxID=3760 RepID=M5XSK1_PRUPE|nr:hypothetical protein PRUPE_2G042200 [Prunus persica]